MPFISAQFFILIPKWLGHFLYRKKDDKPILPISRKARLVVKSVTLSLSPREKHKLEDSLQIQILLLASITSKDMYDNEHLSESYYMVQPENDIGEAKLRA